MNKTKDQQAEEYAEKKFPELLLTIEKEPWPKTREILAKAYTDGYTDGYTAPDQSMTDGEAPVMQWWVARDRDDNTLWMYTEKPLRDGNVMWYGKEPIKLPTDFFPFLTWSDEPIECEILIKPKKR